MLGSDFRRDFWPEPDLWIEWQERQFTASDDACTLFQKDARSADCLWQVRHVSVPVRPWRVLMSDLSPSASMCFVPSPWHVSQTAFPPAPLWAAR